MASTRRIIPRLDIKGPNVVKGIRLEGLRVLGKPEAFASYYYEHGADELFFQDVVASLYERNSLHDIVKRTASRVFIPLCVGGGLRSLDDIKTVLRAGADKVALNTAVVRDHDLIRQASRRFGSSTIVVSIEAGRLPSGGYEALTDNGRERTGLDAVEWATKAAEFGAGELLVTCVDVEGTGRGFELGLVEEIKAKVGIPVIAGGGAGHVTHVADVLAPGRADAAACAALFHYEAIRNIKQTDDFHASINLNAMRTRAVNSSINPSSIPRLRAALKSAGVDVRTTEVAGAGA